MPFKPPLQPGAYYHVYNRGLNKAPLFNEDADFLHFIDLMNAYLTPVSEVFSYALMRNHYHVALRIKTDDEVGWLIRENADSEDPFVKWSTTFEPPSCTNGRKPEIQFMLRHLLSAYSKWFNIRNQRSGKLFEERHERKIVSSDHHLKQLICYINRNPEHHHITKSFLEYPWISYHGLLSDSPTWLSAQKVIELFEGRKNFTMAMHKIDFDEWLKDLEYDS